MWVKIDDGFATHPKILTAGIVALGIQIRAICYASQNQTDGKITPSAVPLFLIGTDPTIDWPAHMVQHGLWDIIPSGYVVHDYLEWNLSKNQRDNFLKKKRQAGKKGMKRRWGTSDSSITDVITDVITPVKHAGITKPYHATSTSTSSLSESEFEQFWNQYPRRIGKKAAHKAWTAAKDRPPLPRIVSALTTAKQSPDWTKDNGKFIPHPATWLNQGRWDDVLAMPPRKERLPL